MSGSVSSLNTTQAISSSAAERTRKQTPRLWYTLVWKDVRQIAPAILAIVLGLLLLQMIAALGNLAFLPQASWQTMTEAIAVFALISPVLVSLACGGMLIGHERQTRTWDWNSTLPVAWQFSLASKLVVSVAAMLLSLLVLAILPTISAMYFGAWSREGWVANNYATAFYGILVLDTMVFFLLATLLFRDALTGLLWGGGAVLLLQFLAVMLPLQILAFWGQPSDRVPGWILATETIVILLAGLAALIWTFRWRWGVGQSTNISLLPRNYRSPVVPAYAPERHGHAPSMWRMLCSLNARSSFGKRAAILGLLLVGLIFGWWQEPEGFAALGLFLSVLFGVTAFEGDQTNRRYGFLADRGASSGKLVASRLLLPILFALAMFFLVLGAFAVVKPPAVVWQDMMLPMTALFVGYILAALAGALASLSFDKAVVSAVVAIVTVVFACVVYVTLFEAAHWMDPNPYWLGAYSLGLFLMTSLPALFWALSRWVPSWLIRMRPRFGRRYFALISSLIIVPILVVANGGFLLIPKVPWKGLPESQWNRAFVSVPDLSDRPDLLKGLETGYAGISRTPHDIESMYQDFKTRYLRDGALRSDLSEIPAQILLEIEAGLSTSRKQKAREFASRHINEQLISTALIANLYSDIDDYERARQALQQHGRLRRIASESLAVETSGNRIASAFLFDRHLSLEEMRQLGTEDELREWLLPDIGQTEAQYVDFARAQATLDREIVRGRRPDNLADSWPIRFSIDVPWITTLLPPLRWRAERAIALQLSEAIEAIHRGPAHAQRIFELDENPYLRELYFYFFTLRSDLSQLESKIAQVSR